MMALQIPTGGLKLSRPKTGPSKDGDQHSQVVSLDIAENKTKELLKALKSGKKVSLHSGRQPSIRYVDYRLPLQTAPSKYASELYTRSKYDETALYFSGALSHTLELRDAVEASAGANSALETLQSTLKSMKEERALNETYIVRSRDDLKKSGKGEHRASPLLGYRKELLGGAPRSTPSSPYLSASYSPRPPPTSAPAQTGAVTSQDKIRQDAMKISIVHLLASKPMSSKAVQATIRASKDDCDRVLEKHAQDCQSMSGKKELKQRAYRDLDVWKFPYDRPENRAAAIERAIHAYDRMRVEKSDPLWQMLLKPEERGKGKMLSKLNFNKPTPTPKPHESKDEMSETDPVRSPKKTSSAGTKNIDRSRHDVDRAGSKHHASSPAVQRKRELSSKPASQNPKPESRFKSSEVIEDSDEEAKAAEEILAKPKAAKQQERTVAPAHSSTERMTSSSPKKHLHNSTKSNSSSASDSSDSRTSNATLKPPVGDSSAYSQRSPRPRHDSSPQKPSPLGSSPPTTSTDADSSSSNKGTSQSSAPSSPPSSIDMPVAKQKQKYSPIITDRPRDASRDRVATKRKSNEVEEAPASKRQQMDRPDTPKLANGLHKHTDRPHFERKISESERSSSPEKPGPVREDVVDQAKRFQLYYKKYKDLHEKIANIPEKDREDKETEDLYKMHERLAEMKTDIWKKWEKVEKQAT